jgi:hypothetical protein
MFTAISLILGQQTAAVTTQNLGAPGDMFNVTGLREAEQGENGMFRWGDERVTLRLQPLGFPHYAVLKVQGVRPEGEPLAVVGAEAAGKSLGVRDIPRSPSVLEYRLPAASLLEINPQLTLTSTLFQPPGDRRVLGIVYYTLEQRNGSGPALPSPWPAAALILSGILAYLAARLVSGSTRTALIVAAAWGVGIGVLNSLVRPWLVFYSWYFVVPPLVVLLLWPWLHGAWVRRRDRTSADEPARIEPEITRDPRPVAIAVTTAALLTMAWHLIAPREPESLDPTHNLSWGASFFGALPWPLQVLGALALVGLVVWGWLAPYTPPAQLGTGGEEEVLPAWFPWALAGAGMTLFALVPVAYSEGDSSEFDTKIPKGAIWRERELLDFYLKVRLWRLLEPILRLPSQVYQLVAVISGGIYLWGAALLGRTLGRNRREALVIIAGLATIGNFLLFFRYVESYAPVTAISLFVIWACWRYSEGKLSFGSVAAIATLAPLFHGSALWWGPMVLAAWLVRAQQFPAEVRWRKALLDLREGVFVGLAIMAVVVSVMLIDAYDYERLQTGLAEMGGGDGRTMLPLFNIETRFEHYAFFSWPHLGAVIQEQSLVAPMALLTIIIVAVMAWRGTANLARVVPPLITLAVGAAGMFFYSITWNPDLGPRNDWDLLALPALPLTLLALFLLIHLPEGRPRRAAITAYLALSGVHTAAWVLLHVLGIRY